MRFHALVPNYQEEEQQRRANILAVTQLAAGVMIIAILIISAWLTPEHVEVLVQGIVGSLAMLVSYFFLRKGKLELSAWIVVTLGWLILTMDLMFISGIRGVNVLGQVLIVMFTGLVLSGKSALIVTAITLGANFLVLQLEINGVLASPAPLPSNFTRWFIQSIYISLAAVYIWRADTVINRSLAKSKATADRFLALFRHTTDCVVVFNPEWQVMMANPRIFDLLGYTEDEVIGHRMLPEKLSATPQEIADYQQQVKSERNIPPFEQMLLQKDGSEVPVEISITIVPDNKGNPEQIQCVLRDITDRKAYEKHLKYQALHDPLTDLPNRAYFEDRYQTSQLGGEKNEDLVAIMFLDLDDFKNVNDQYGHLAGDKILIQIGSRLKGSLRESDTVVRIGGDEFLIVLDNAASKTSVERVAEKIIRVISQPYQIDDHQIKLTASLGIRITRRCDLDPIDLISSSDQAMYKVKELGKNDYLFFEVEGDN
jgi:diguanylate cyclase (GGDEF)-like protein/PAS domain S-box-containing protein